MDNKPNSMIDEKQITQQMLNNKIYPAQAVEMRVQLSGLYSFYSSSLEDILLQKPKIWATLRVNHKSDKQCDLEYMSTENGKNELGLGMRLKRLEKMLSSLKSVIDNANTDYHHTK